MKSSYTDVQIKRADLSAVAPKAPSAPRVNSWTLAETSQKHYDVFRYA